MSSPRLALASATVFVLLPFASAFAQVSDSTARVLHEDAPRIAAARLDGTIRLDGALDDAPWAQATPATYFTQLDPEEGKPCSERTEVRVLVGADAIYIGARLFDREPAKVKARLSRRDDPVETDIFEVSIDSYHDHLTAR